MNTTEAAIVSRVRALALAAMARAGGRPTRAQVIRVLRPIGPGLADALEDRPPWEAADDVADRCSIRPGLADPGECCQAAAVRTADRGCAVVATTGRRPKILATKPSATPTGRAVHAPSAT